MDLTEEERRQIQADTARVLGFWAADIDEYIKQQYGDAVQAGPFKGMRLVAKQVGGLSTLGLIGAFELELHPALTRLLARGGFDQIVNVGGAEGYYAIGMALNLPDTPAVVFEAEPSLHKVITANAQANGVAQRLELKGLCDFSAFKETLAPNAMVFMDCEGCEVDLIQPDAIPNLSSAALIVELHDCFRPESSRVLQERMTATHDVEIIEVQGRDATQYPALQAMPQFQQYLALCEFRPPNIRWGVFTPKA